jgi:hypothetical protein
MQSKNTPEEPPNLLRKEWHPPQCYRKTWQTPKLTALEFSQTKGGIFPSVGENSSGTVTGS